MPSYQVPQFLDSGEKILGPLNLRQFAYALIGGLLCFILYNIFATIVGSIIAIVLVSPLAMIIAGIALGKYNGRDAEIYLYKSIEYFKKPKTLYYKRQAHTPLLDDRLSHLTISYLSQSMDNRYHTQLQQSQNSNNFETLNPSEKFRRIQQLSTSLDARQFTYQDLEQQNQQNQNLALKVFEQHKPESIYKHSFQSGTTLAARA